MCEQGRGTFIVLEGGEGAGKDSVIAYLRDRLAERGDVVFTREPGGTALGERVREMLMDHVSRGMSVETEILLFLVARAHLVHEVVEPALASGNHVISNRFALSTVAYQIYRKDRHAYRALLDSLTMMVADSIQPHYILLDVDPEVGLARVRSRAGEITRFDVESLETHQRVRAGYCEAVQHHPHVIVDANRSIEYVQTDVWNQVTRWLMQRHSMSET